MASVSSHHCMLSASSRCAQIPRKISKSTSRRRRPVFFSVRAASSSASQEDPTDCNDEECAPNKEVGKVSVEWLASEKTKVVGTFPPRKRGWTGYVEKDTAGQTNIYSVEPSVYVAENVLSSGTSGTSAEGSENNIAIAAGLALISIAAASSILIQVGKNQPGAVGPEYNGPPLSYYISKFKPAGIVEASAPPEQDEGSSAQTPIAEESPEVLTSATEASLPPETKATLS